MKFQYLAVIFIIIILPVALVLSFYVQTQNAVMNRQNMYRAKLSDATYDAVKAFQINTTNSYYSSVSDSKIRDIEAAVNAFYNSLTTNLNYKKEELQAYVPAIVYTLYDGYYIYGKRYNVYPKEDVKINESGELIEMEIIRDKGNNEVEEIVDTDLYEYGLKPFVYYSCQYQRGSDNFVVNYTLDNFISIYGTIGGQYVNKSGYLIQINSGNGSFNGNYKGINIANTGENLTEYLKFTDTATSQPADGEYPYAVYRNQKIYRNGSQYFWYDQGVAHPIQGETTIQEIEETFGKSSSYEYYQNAYEFSKWVYDHLKDIKQNNIRTVVRKDDGSVEVTAGGTNLAFNAQNESIFDTTKDPEDPASIFNQHRIAVIKNSIETNLAAAINSYNSNANSFSYELPKLSEEEWDKVVNNVCMISFMQGMPIGGKYFNDYIVIPNDKNNEFVDTDSIYLMTNDGKYHMPNCPLLVESNGSSVIGGYINTAFQRQTVDSTYYYRHMNNGTPYTPCYQCLVNSSGKYDLEEDIINNTRNNINGVGSIATLRQKYFSILGREKNNLYKTNN